MLYFKGDVNKETCDKCAADDLLLAFQARSRTRQERTLIIAQQAEADFQQVYDLHCMDSKSVQAGKLRQRGERRRKVRVLACIIRLRKWVVSTVS